MFKPGSKLYAIRKSKCPRCHLGNLFKSSLLSGEGVYNMHKKCTVCQQDFEIEPGFYWGAMYIGYALYSFYLFGTTAILFFIIGTSLNLSFFITLIGAIIMIPYNARRARVWWINIMVGYNKNMVDSISTKEPPINKSKK